MGGGGGRLLPAPGLQSGYFDHLVKSAPVSLAGLRVVVDCAHGAAFEVGREVLAAAGAEVVVLFAWPDGENIVDGCGSTDMSQLSSEVVAGGADLGLAFDGDADRLLAVDAEGRTVDGDQVLAITALER